MSVNNYLTIWSPELARFATEALLREPSGVLSARTRQELESAMRQIIANPMLTPNIFRRLKISVDLTPLHLLERIREESIQRELAMRFLIARQAHYPLLHQLFNASGSEIHQVRKKCKASQPPRQNAAFPIPELEQLWKEWKQIKAEFPREINQWMVLAEKRPNYALSTLYRALVVDARGGK